MSFCYFESRYFFLCMGDGRGRKGGKSVEKGWRLAQTPFAGLGSIEDECWTGSDGGM